MGNMLTGTVRGRAVELDQHVERLDGQRVLVILELIVEPETELPEAWRDWTDQGPDGPLQDPPLR
jgi:hypothetical protein